MFSDEKIHGVDMTIAEALRMIMATGVTYRSLENPG
jgi:uncharacterized membrane protein